MTQAARRVERVYLTLTLLNTLAASFIWGVNTLFLLDAGLTIAQAFLANAFYTLGMVIFEVPTGVVADTRGRRFSFLLGAATLLVSTLLYLSLWVTHGPLWGWLATSALLGLGFTFFSGATEAWLVDALRESGAADALEKVFAHAQIVGGAAMLVGSAAGGVVAQATNLGVPYVIRSVLLGVTFLVALWLMRDIGFVPDRDARPLQAVRTVLDGALEGGWRNPPVRWLMLAAPFTGGVSVFVFYALQPYLLELYGDPNAYSIAGLAAALVASAQIFGGLLVPVTRRLFRTRTGALLSMGAIGAAALAAVGAFHSYGAALALITLWAIAGSIALPLRQGYLNGLIPSQQRATVLSFDSVTSSAGGVVIQPAMGAAADALGYGAALMVSAIVQAVALPFGFLARRTRASSDPIA